MFDEIIGNGKIKEALEKTVNENKVSHSYMFVGIDGIGKQLVAKKFAQAILCTKETEKSCNQCKSCIEFMSNNHPDYEGKVVVVSGCGNVAMDAARCAKRLGAEEVYIVYRRSEEELPARKEEVEHAKEEGIIFKLLNNPIEIIEDPETHLVKGMKCIRMELGEPDASGRRRPIPVEGSEFVLDVDCVIISIGTSPNPLIKSTTKGLDTNSHGCIIAEETTGKTSREGVYAGGDAVTGAATVILAMGAGKHAAKAIDEYISSK